MDDGFAENDPTRQGHAEASLGAYSIHRSAVREKCQTSLACASFV
jgi:hypothetical protein